MVRWKSSTQPPGYRTPCGQDIFGFLRLQNRPQPRTDTYTMPIDSPSLASAEKSGFNTTSVTFDLPLTVFNFHDSRGLTPSLKRMWLARVENCPKQLITVSLALSLGLSPFPLPRTYSHSSFTPSPPLPRTICPAATLLSTPAVLLPQSPPEPSRSPHAAASSPSPYYLSQPAALCSRSFAQLSATPLSPPTPVLSHAPDGQLGSGYRVT
ncbi:hypothetical protein EDB83DRAFT_1993307 [Lactarius deliciosus]|nr:hypothetical protein EDB83DRAFT_1993307 [Lactarius deliciosus]